MTTFELRKYSPKPLRLRSAAGDSGFSRIERSASGAAKYGALVWPTAVADAASIGGVVLLAERLLDVRVLQQSVSANRLT